MSDCCFTLVSDGPSDRALIPALSWVLAQHSARVFRAEWPDLRRLRRPPRGLQARISVALELAPCDLLFVHRDAERDEPARRRGEIEDAVRELGHQLSIPVVPVRMTEAWLIWNEGAIRRAAGNPNGRASLGLPAAGEVEGRANPKADLFAALVAAGGFSGRRRDDLRPAALRQLVADAIEDYSPLRGASAFAKLEADVERVVRDQGW
jgi:hypothetical protein